MAAAPVATPRMASRASATAARGSGGEAGPGALDVIEHCAICGAELRLYERLICDRCQEPERKASHRARSSWYLAGEVSTPSWWSCSARPGSATKAWKASGSSTVTGPPR